MADTRSAVIEIKTLEAVQNVQDLKNNISALKAKLDDVSTSTEEYADITKQLSQNQAALRNVMNGTNSTFQQSITEAKGLDSSYNSLVQQLKEATQEWRTIPRYLTEVDKEQGKVNQAWTDAADKVLQLRSELKNMDEQTGNFTRNVGNYKSALEGFEGAMGQVKQVGGDMLNGFQSISSVMTLLGTNTGALDGLMKGLRSTLGLVQGAKGLAGMISKLKLATTAEKANTTATRQSTTAHATNTIAKGAETTATWTLKGAIDALKAAVTGGASIILSLAVTALSTLVGWLTSSKEATDDLSLSTYGLRDSLKDLKDEYDDLVEEDRHRLAVMKAAGKSEEEIHKKTIEQLEKRKKKAAELEESAKNLERTSRNVLNNAEEGSIAAQAAAEDVKKAQEDAEKYRDKQKKITDEIRRQNELFEARQNNPNNGGSTTPKTNPAIEDAKKIASEIESGVKKATEAVHKQETELQKIIREYDEFKTEMEGVLELIRKQTGYTNEEAIILNGLAAAEMQYRKDLEEYYKKEYEKKAAEQTEKLVNENGQLYLYNEKLILRHKELFDLDSRRARLSADHYAMQQKEYDIQMAILGVIKDEIKETGKVDMSKISEYMAMTPKEVRDKFGEPVATMLLNYFKQSKTAEQAGYEYFGAMLRGFEDEVNEELEKGNFLRIDSLVTNMKMTVERAFRELGIDEGFDEYISQVMQRIGEFKLGSDNPLFGTSFISDLVPESEFEAVTKRIDELKKQLQEYQGEKQKFRMDYSESWIFPKEFKEYNDMELAIETELAMKEQELFNLRLKRFSLFFGQVEKMYSSYGKATSNVMGSVADAWNAALEAQVKSGKRSEESAKASFQFVKGLQMGAAVINTAGAVVQALADTTVPSYYVKVANAAAALAAGTAQIIKISSTDFNASGAGAASSMPRMVERPNQAVTYTVGLNPADYAEAQAQNPVRAYVVDRDLADGLDEYNRRNDETTF